jgi:hypothetical protein
MVCGLGDDRINGGSNPSAPYDASRELPDSQRTARQRFE